MQLGPLPCYYGVDEEVHQFSLLGFLRALFLKTDDDLQVPTATYSSESSFVVQPGVSPGSQTDQQQHTIRQFLPQDTSGAMTIPAGLSSKELARLRLNASRSGPTNPLPLPSPAASADRELLGGTTAEVAPTPEVRRLQSEVDLLRREVERLGAERSEPPPTYISGEAA